MDDIVAARAAARAQADHERHFYFDECRRDFDRWCLEGDDERFLSLITRGRISDRALLCNERVRRSLQHALIDALLAEHQVHPQRQWLWITLCWDNALTWERAPEIDTKALVNTASLHLRRCDLDGVGILETDVWKNITGEPGRRVVPHVHFIGYPRYGERYDVEGLAANLCDRRALANPRGGDSVRIIEVGTTPSDFAWLGRYMSKPPAYAKNPVPDGDGHKLRSVKHAQGSVARLTEIFSYLELGDVLFSIGAGKSIAGAVRREVRKAVERSRQSTPAPARDLIEKHWRRIRLTNGSQNLRECRIATRREPSGLALAKCGTNVN